MDCGLPRRSADIDGNNRSERPDGSLRPAAPRMVPPGVDVGSGPARENEPLEDQAQEAAALQRLRTSDVGPIIPAQQSPYGSGVDQ
jgi:hypothetical protein